MNYSPLGSCATPDGHPAQGHAAPYTAAATGPIGPSSAVRLTHRSHHGVAPCRRIVMTARSTPCLLALQPPELPASVLFLFLSPRSRMKPILGIKLIRYIIRLWISSTIHSFLYHSYCCLCVCVCLYIYTHIYIKNSILILQFNNQTIFHTLFLYYSAICFP
jgi:hypothetical protein